MHLRNLMNTTVHTCAPNDTLAFAARLMWERDVGCLVVVDAEHHPIAMITDRDIAMAAYIQGCALQDLPVHIAMSRRIVACPPECTVSEAERIMQAEQVRRLPVVDLEGRLIGIIALGDLAHDAIATRMRMPVAVPRLAKTLAAVTERRDAVRH